MKKYTTLFLLTIIIFGALTILTIQDLRPVDGNYFCGFPLAFYTQFSEMTYPNPSGEMVMYRMNYLFLIIDILIAFLLSLLVFAVIRKIRKKK